MWLSIQTVQTVDIIFDTITGFESKIALSYVAGFVLISTLSVTVKVEIFAVH